MGKVEETAKTSAVEEQIEEANAAGDDDSSDGELEYKEEHRFPNGAIYKGGWKNG